jgi:hypothetical protein
MLTLSKEEHCARFKQLGRSLEDQIAADAPASVLQLYYNFAMKMFCELEMMDTPEPPWLLDLRRRLEDERGELPSRN